MTASTRFLALAGVTGLALMGLLAGSAPSEDRPEARAFQGIPPNPELDRNKNRRIEPAIANVVKNNTGAFLPTPNGQPAFRPPVRVDIGKSKLIEPQVQQFLAAASKQAPPAKAAEFVNPKVEPGKVRWHGSFAQAQAAAVKSKKPIMIFQMMGKLDDQFC